MFSLVKSCAILLALSLGCVSSILHPRAYNGEWETLTGPAPSGGRRFLIWAPGPDECVWPDPDPFPGPPPSAADAGNGTDIAARSLPFIPYSVILAFHGRNGNPERMSRVSRFHLYARPFGAQCSIVIYPEGLPGSDGQRAWQPAPYADLNAGDVQFVRDILQWVRNKYDTYASTKEIYASGKSNGASLVAWLACMLSDKIAAFAPVSGPMYLAQDLITPDPTCSPVRSVPIIEFHGTDDNDAPYCPYTEKRLGGKISTVMSWVRWWASKNRCTFPPVRSNGPDQEYGLRKTEIERYTGCQPGSEVVHYRIVHGLHDWPSLFQMDDNTDEESNPSRWVPTCPSWATQTWSPGTVEATEIIMSFFRNWRLP